MAYNLHYYYSFKNAQLDNWRVEILKDGFVGISTQLIGAGQPFVLETQSGDGDIYSAIKPTVATLAFLSESLNGNSISLEDFYTDADNVYRVDFYNDDTNDLIWTGFVQIDNGSEDLQDQVHVITLQANDNIGVLKNIPFPNPTLTQVYEGILLQEIFGVILPLTGLQLNTNAYLNIFENNTDDRTVVDTNDLLQQTAIYTSNLVSGNKNTVNPAQAQVNGTSIYKDCYSILNDILYSFGATLMQANGVWNIFREGEFRLYGGQNIQGTQYNYNFTTVSYITLNTPAPIQRNPLNTPNIMSFVNVNQQMRILKPYEFAERIFSFVQPTSLIVQADLSLPMGAVPYATSTGTYTPPGGGTGIPARFDNYSIATYFPSWKPRTGSTSYLQVVTATAVLTEIDRYIVTPGSGVGTHNKGVQFNNIPCSAGDTFDLSVNFRTNVPSTDDLRFWIRVDLIYDDGTHYASLQNDGTGALPTVHWITNLPIANWDIATGMAAAVINPSGNDTINNRSWSLSGFLQQNEVLPTIPHDGVLLIQVNGTDGDPGNQTTLWNDITITFTNRINNSLNATGQYHFQSQPKTIKNNTNTQLNFDDSPRNSISGTYLITPEVNFLANVGNLYFTKSLYWHRLSYTESLRLNQINTFDSLFIQRIKRTIVEGDIFGLKYIPPGIIAGVGNIFADDSFVIFSGLTTIDGIYPGMFIEFEGYSFEIISVNIYNTSPFQVQVYITGGPSAIAFYNTRFTILWHVKFISMLNTLMVDFYPGKNFIQGISKFDFMSCVWNTTMYELWDNLEEDSDLDNTYIFNYLFKNS